MTDLMGISSAFPLSTVPFIGNYGTREALFAMIHGHKYEPTHRRPAAAQELQCASYGDLP